jgi:hypothetical protein
MLLNPQDSTELSKTLFNKTVLKELLANQDYQSAKELNCMQLKINYI